MGTRFSQGQRAAGA